MAQVLAVVSDLMLASRVSESLKAAGHEVTIAPSLPSPVEADTIVCDLDTTNAADVAATGIPTLGFYSHVDVDTRNRAQEAGLAQVVPRSRMARELPELITKLLT